MASKRGVRETAGRQAVAACLRDNGHKGELWLLTLAAAADRAARQAGATRDLFPTVAGYARLLPAGAAVRVGRAGADEVLVATNPFAAATVPLPRSQAPRQVAQAA